MARGALTAAAGSVVVLLAGAGVRSIPLLLLVIGQVAVVLAGLWVAFAHRGALRIGGLALAIAAVVSAAAVEAAGNLLWVVTVCVALVIAATVAGRAALGETWAEPPEERPVAAPRQPFFVMNPRSGGGKVERFELRARAERLGAAVALLDGGDPNDAADLARKAVADGADLLGVAAGDGTQALIAGVAAEHNVPLLVIPAGTRNHFALDLGLDRDDPARSLEAMDDGVELRIDLGEAGCRPFVNNVSFGAYAEIVARPDYRDDKRRVTLDVLPEVLTGHRGAQLRVCADGVVVDAPTAALVSNNPYGTGDLAGLGRRARLDGGVLGLVTVRVATARQAADLVRGKRARGVTALTAKDVVVESDADRIPVGLDGESVSLPTPVRCTIRPGALRVRVPRQRPGTPRLREPLTLTGLLRLAGWARPPQTQERR